MLNLQKLSLADGALVRSVGKVGYGVIQEKYLSFSIQSTPSPENCQSLTDKIFEDTSIFEH